MHPLCWVAPEVSFLLPDISLNLVAVAGHELCIYPESIRSEFIENHFPINSSGIICKNKNQNFLVFMYRGRTPEWYNKSYGHIAALHLSKIRSSFKHTTDGPESNVWGRAAVQQVPLHGLHTTNISEQDEEQKTFKTVQLVVPTISEEWAIQFTILRVFLHRSNLIENLRVCKGKKNKFLKAGYQSYFMKIFLPSTIFCTETKWINRAPHHNKNKRSFHPLKKVTNEICNYYYSHGKSYDLIWCKYFTNKQFIKCLRCNFMLICICDEKMKTKKKNIHTRTWQMYSYIFYTLVGPGKGYFSWPHHTYGIIITFSFLFVCL